MGDISNKNSNIRVLRQKDVADVTKDVLNNKSDITQIESSLHRSYRNLDRSGYAEREAMKSILDSSLLLAGAVAKLAQRVLYLENEVQMLKEQNL